MIEDTGRNGSNPNGGEGEIERLKRELYASRERERAARAEVEEARRETANILENTTDAFVALDDEWRFTHVNSVAAGIVGASMGDPEDLLGEVLWEVFPELVGTGFEAGLLRAARGSEAVEFEEYFLPPGLWLRVRAYSAGGGVSAYVEDVTERRRGREALQRNEARWRALIDKGADVITISDRDGKVRYASPSIEPICGYAVEEFVGSDPFESGYIHPDDLKRCEAVFRGLMDDPGRSVTLRHRYRHGSGEWRWLEGSFTSLFHDPAISGLVANFRDITGREQAEGTIRESEEKYRTLFDSMDEGFHLAEVLFDEDDRPVDIYYLESNPAANRMVGMNYAGRQLTGIDPSYEPYWVETFGRVARTGESERLEMYAGSLETWFNFNVFRVGDADGRHIAVLFEDITERKRREANAAFLTKIRDDFTRLASTDEIMQIVGAKIGAYMKLATCNFIDIDESRGELVVSYFWDRTDVPSKLGTFRIEDFLNEEWGRASRAGEMIVVRDTRTDPRTNARSYATLELGAFVVVPFDRRSEWKYFLTVTDSLPRDWREDEIELFQELSNHIFPRLERARAEEASRESEARLRTVADVVPDLLWSNDPHGEVDWYNRRWSEYTGQTPEEAKNHGWLDIIHPNDREATQRSFQRALDRGEPLRQEHRIRDATGGYRWFLVRASPLKDDDGEIVHWYGAATDIHEERAALEALRTSEERYRSLATASSLMVWRGNGAGEIAVANPSWEAYTGQSYEEYSGMGWLDAVYPEDRPRVAGVWEATLRNKAPIEVGFRLRRAGGYGPYHRVVARGVPILDEDGGTVREWIGTITEVEDGRRAEEVLRETELRMMALFHSDVIGIASGEEDYILEANEVLLESLGYDREDLLDRGLNWVEMTPPEEREWIVNALEESKQTGSFGPFEKHFVCKDGTLVPTIVGGYCLSADPFRYTKFVLDVSEQKRAEEALRESEERLRTVVEGAPVVVFALDREGNYTLAVGRGLDVLGFGQNELVGRSVFETYADHPKSLEDVRRALSGEAFTAERTVGGSVFEIHYNPARGEWGEVTSVIGIATDVTTRKEAERERDRLLARQWRARAEAEERRRISRELHDRVAHSIGVVYQSLELYEALKERDEAAAAARMELARKTVKEALDNTRGLSRELRGLEIADRLSLALPDAVRTTVPPGLESEVRVRGDESLVPPEVREQLFLILREGVRNAVAHSGADKLVLTVDVGEGKVMGRVEDDGKGFDGALEEADGGLGGGLRSMKERAELVGGEFEIHASPGGGTTIIASIPLDGAGGAPKDAVERGNADG